MRGAVTATGRQVKELDAYDAVELGCVSAVERLQRGGRLLKKQHLCQAAARSGNLEKLKQFRRDRFPWDARTCLCATMGGHFEVLRWARANRASWDTFKLISVAQAKSRLICVAKQGEILRWLRANN